MNKLTPTQRLHIFLQAFQREGLIQKDSAETNPQKYTLSVDRTERLIESALSVAQPSANATTPVVEAFLKFKTGAENAITTLKQHPSYQPQSINTFSTLNATIAD